MTEDDVHMHLGRNDHDHYIDSDADADVAADDVNADCRAVVDNHHNVVGFDNLGVGCCYNMDPCPLLDGVSTAVAERTDVVVAAAVAVPSAFSLHLEAAVVAFGRRLHRPFPPFYDNRHSY